MSDDTTTRAPAADVSRANDAEAADAPKDEGLKAFVLRAQTTLAPALSEILSEETRKTQRMLLVTTFGLLLLARSELHVSGIYKQSGLEFSVEQPMVIRALLAICVYLEVLVCIRCYTDWRWYRVTTSVADLDLRYLLAELSTEHPTDDEDILRKPLDETREAIAYRAALNFGRADGIARTKRTLDRLQERHDRVRIFREKKSFIDEQLSAVMTSRSLRVIWEILFPMVFGAIAIAFAALS
jgi:hypothetical protein